MPRIVYVLLSNGGVAGGQKMILRHVEALRDLGFNAVCYIGAQSKVPAWLSHDAPLELGTPVRADDILVLPDDGREALITGFRSPLRSLIFSQNPYYFSARTFDVVEQIPPGRFPVFISVGRRLSATILRAFPQAQVELIPCFADERLFRPAGKRPAVALAPRKRMVEAASIRAFLHRFHPRHDGLEWRELLDATEAEVAEGFSTASLCLSLSRLESVGMTTLEAMASGCVCAGFTGLGGWEYATAENGFWVGEDDCEAATDALAAAADLVRTGGAPYDRMVEAARETAGQWSYQRFRAALEEVWMRLAPEARLRDGPLD
jgi:hypothetical protein